MIGVPDELKGEAIVAFVVAKPGVAPGSSLERELETHLVEAMGPTFKPRAVVMVHELPTTQSGKIVRRLLRQKYLGETLGDVSTVANPEALETR